MKRFMTFLKIEGKLALRCPDGIIFGIGMPIGILFLIGVIGKDALVQDGSYTFFQSAFASLITVGICATAFMGLPITFADYRDKKILKHFFVTPVSPSIMLFVQVVIAAFTAIISAICVSIVAVICFDYHMNGNLWIFIAAFVLVMISMYSIGMVLASVCKNVKSANVVTTFVYFPMVFLSGATIPFELFPETLQHIANILPLTHGIRLLKDISLGVGIDQWWPSVLLLLVFAVFGCILSIKTFRWD